MLSGSNKDITNRKQKEEKLVRYKELLKKAKKIARIGTWEVNLTNETVEWDEVTKDIYEAPPNFIREYYGGLDSYKKGYSRTLIKRTFRESIKNEKEFDIEVEINTLKGNEKWIRLIGFPIIIDGKCVSLHSSPNTATQPLTKIISGGAVMVLLHNGAGEGAPPR